MNQHPFLSSITRRLPWKNRKYSAMQAFLSFGVPAQLTGKFASVDHRDWQFACGGLDITLDINRKWFKLLYEFPRYLRERFEIFTKSVKHFLITYMSYKHTFKSHNFIKILGIYFSRNHYTCLVTNCNKY